MTQNAKPNSQDKKSSVEVIAETIFEAICFLDGMVHGALSEERIARHPIHGGGKNEHLRMMLDR